jgi:succinate dehydrogenase / fumarate reductase flavoprotein subunit
MGGLWVDYNLMSNLPGLFVLGEANFSVHGANRLGASALMQGLADGYFIIPYTLADYLARVRPGGVTASDPECLKSIEDVKAAQKRLLSIRGDRSVNWFRKELGSLLWQHCGMERSRESLTEALARIPGIRDEFREKARIPGTAAEFNPQLESAARTEDFIEFAELLCLDALHRNESCGVHFRTEYQYEDGEAKRDDPNFCYSAAWECKGPGARPELHKEPLRFEHVHLMVRSYK